MKIFITGVSKGLGKALAIYFLEKGNKVTGIGRSTDIHHRLFDFIECDLSDAVQTGNLNFGLLNEEVVLINNAGVIGNIQRLSEQNELDVQQVITVNTIAPMLLSVAITKAVEPNKLLTLVNISSGAGRRAIPSWASYCASKSALDMFSETFYQEELERGREIRVYSVAPGLVDTSMQEKIRSASVDHFSGKQRFVDLKLKNELTSTDEVVMKLEKLIFQHDYEGKVICSL